MFSCLSQYCNDFCNWMSASQHSLNFLREQFTAGYLSVHNVRKWQRVCVWALCAADPLVLFISTQPAGAVCHHALMLICCFVCLCVILKDPEQRKQHTEDAGKRVHVISLAERLVLLASRRVCVCLCLCAVFHLSSWTGSWVKLLEDSVSVCQDGAAGCICCGSTEFLDQANMILSIVSQKRAHFRKYHWLDTVWSPQSSASYFTDIQRIQGLLCLFDRVIAGSGIKWMELALNSLV